ncbi:alanine-zipper protein [Bartonella mastomydis]|uniref:phage major tropism determinant n=2 Tax=Bartonella mastomydis TaxID=1820002 RepID=UPI0011175954|nr:hypothetical protein [Bartonella mastomydis]
MKIPDHSHEYLIPVATEDEIREGTSQSSVVVPKILGTASLYSYETFAPLEQVVNARQEAEKAMARANGAQQVSEEAKKLADESKTIAERAEQTARDASQTATETTQVAATAVATSHEVKTIATQASLKADGAKQTADDAKDMAEGAKGLSEQATSSVTELTKTVSQVEKSVETALTEAREAKEKLEEAKGTGEQALQTASEAKGLAESAKSAADSVTEKVEQALKEANDAKSKAEGLETIVDEAKSTSDQANQTASSSKNLSEEAKQEANLAKTAAEEAKNALTQVQEKAESNSDSISKLQVNVNSLSTYFLENVRFVQPHKILEADPANRKGLVINNGAFFRFYHGGEHGGRYLVHRVPGRGTMTFSETLEAGKDYYIYLILKSGDNDLSYEFSTNPTAPDGYTEHNSEKIGGFHTLCADVGEIEDHPLSGYQAGDILPESVWSLNHRPRSDPEGMVYDSWKNIWVDIYLQSGIGKNTKSAYGVPITTNYSYAEHLADFLSVNKRFLTSDEFSSCMAGSNAQTSITGNQPPSPKTSGGHVDTDNRRMISDIGCEDGCGYVWQFLSGCYPVTKWHTAEQGSSLRVDINVMLGGGDWSGGSNNHHLARNFAYSRYDKDEKIGARGCSEPFYYN